MARATIQYISMKAPDGEPSREQMVIATDDGTYQIVVPPGKGHLLVFGSTHDYLLEVIGRRMLSDGQPGGGAPTPTRSSPTRPGPSTGRTRSTRACGRAGPSRAG